LFVYTPDVVASALRLLETHSVTAVGATTGVAPRTLRQWRAGETPRRHGSVPLNLSALPARSYAYLLGVYLGDGCISRMLRTWRLRIVLDERYPAVIEETASAMAAIGIGVVGRQQRVGCIELSNCWIHWPSVSPQHGPGRKHERSIALETWQEQVASAHPDRLIRGLIHSDGCRYVAHQRVGDRTYEYSRYEFANRSDDIKRIFCRYLDLLGIGWTRPNEKSIAIARRGEVAKLDAFVGPKR
jgi:hypothetical protein